MSRYIDVSNLDIPSDENDYDELVAFADKIAEMIVDAPTIDIPHSDDWERYSERLWKNAYERGKADRPQGEWLDYEIPLEDGGAMPIQVCNLCKAFYPLAYTGGGHRFCPNCGAKMSKESE